MKRFWILLTVVALAVTFGACREETVPEQTEPESTEQAQAQPDTTELNTTEQNTTQPDTTQPADSAPAEEETRQTAPAVTEPEVPQTTLQPTTVDIFEGEPEIDFSDFEDPQPATDNILPEVTAPALKPTEPETAVPEISKPSVPADTTKPTVQTPTEPPAPAGTTKPAQTTGEPSVPADTTQPVTQAPTEPVTVTVPVRPELPVQTLPRETIPNIEPLPDGPIELPVVTAPVLRPTEPTQEQVTEPGTVETTAAVPSLAPDGYSSIIVRP